MRIILENTVYGIKDKFHKDEADMVLCPVKVIIETPFDDLNIGQCVDMFKQAMKGFGWQEGLVDRIEVKEKEDE